MKTRHELLGSLSEAADSCDKWGDSPSTSRSLLRLNETPGRRLAQGLAPAAPRAQKGTHVGVRGGS